MDLFIADYLVIALYVALLAGVALLFRNRGTYDTRSYFAAGNNSPWWLLGISMVATTFAADTPLAVTGIVAKDGLAGNWIWWSFMFSGLLTALVYAPLWKRSGVLTDVELISHRYSGRAARVLRSFRAFYLALPINCIILGWVTLGMSKILTVLTGAPQWQVIVLLYLLTGLYIAITGIWGVLLTDAVQFGVAMLGSILFAWLSVDAVGGFEPLLIKLQMLGHGPELLHFFPETGTPLFTTFLVWVGVMWWASWYPGAEPGGGGYVVQRLVSARSERDSVIAALLFNIAHFALRPWPWILVALVSMVYFPDLADKEAGYPAMMKEILPPGLYGLMLVVFVSAFVSTVSTHLNWGASYLINDVYRVMRKPETHFASVPEAEAHYVRVGQGATLLIMGLSILISYYFDSVKGGWEALLSIGAGIGPVLLFRWFWRRINAWSELSAMLAAAAGTVLLQYAGLDDFSQKLFWNTILTTAVWIPVTFLTRPEPAAILDAFYAKVHPATGAAFWAEKLLLTAAGAAAIVCFLAGMRDVFFFSIWTGAGYFVVGAALAGLVVWKGAEK
jgi:Na+/proline symporter